MSVQILGCLFLILSLKKGTLYFLGTIQNRTLEIIKEARDCADVLRDLSQIEQAKVNLSSTGYGAVFVANQLDRELRKKYPTIDMMLDIANAMLPPSTQASKIRSEVDQMIANLNQDYCGILCDTAAKKRAGEKHKRLH